MVENKEYSPTLLEWDELVLLWNRSKTMFANTLATNVRARIAWTAEAFVENHPGASPRAVYVWLERSLEIAKGSAPVGERLSATQWHDEITATHRISRSTFNGQITTLAGCTATPGNDDARAGTHGAVSPPSVAPGSGVHRQG